MQTLNYNTKWTPYLSLSVHRHFNTLWYKNFWKPTCDKLRLLHNMSSVIFPELYVLARQTSNTVLEDLSSFQIENWHFNLGTSLWLFSNKSHPPSPRGSTVSYLVSSYPQLQPSPHGPASRYSHQYFANQWSNSHHSCKTLHNIMLKHVILIVIPIVNQAGFIFASNRVLYYTSTGK